jgi:hypothetical protein
VTGRPSREMVAVSTVSSPAATTSQVHVVAVHLVNQPVRAERLRVEGAGHKQVGAQDEWLAARRLEVREHPPRTGGQVDLGAPLARRRVQHRVHVLEAGQVAADHDQVQVALVPLVVRRDRVAVRVADRERQPLSAGGEPGLGEQERVPVGRSLQAADVVVRHLVHAAHVLARVLAHVPVTGRVDRLRGHRPDEVADAERDHEERGAAGGERQEPGQDAHASE